MKVKAKQVNTPFFEVKLKLTEHEFKVLQYIVRHDITLPDTLTRCGVHTNDVTHGDITKLLNTMHRNLRKLKVSNVNASTV